MTVKSYPNVPNTDWLEVYYDAKGLATGAVTTVNDLKPSSLGSAINSSSVTDVSVSNEAFAFNGSSSGINATLSNPQGAWAHSTSVWIKLGKDHSAYNDDNVFCIGSVAGTAQLESLRINANDVRFITFQGGADAIYSLPMDRDRWYHFTLTYDGGAGQKSLRLFRDGIEYTGTTTATPVALSLAANSLLSIGYERVRNQKYFNGSIANFRLFNRALTSDEIYQLYAYQKEYFGHGDLSMTLKAGRLGIGTSEPRAALDVRGTLKVNGPATFTGRPNFTESLFFYTGNTPTNYYASTYKNRHGFYLNTLIPPNSHIGNYGTGGDNQVFTESSYGGGNELCGSHFDYMVYWLKNAPVGHVHRLNWCSNNGSGGSQTYGQKTSGTQIRLWGYWFHTGTYDKDWTGGVDFNISTSTVSVFYEGATFQ